MSDITMISSYVLEHCTFFAIDPSIRACGWALLKKGKITAGLCRSKEKDSSVAALEIYRGLKFKCPWDVNHLIIERPVILEKWTQTKTSAIEKLLACYGACLALSAEKTRIWTPSVPEWKGQISKEISHRRTEVTLEKNNIKFEMEKDIPKSLQHNTKDAIALLTRYLKKERLLT